METRTVARSFALGLACGLRSMTGPAVIRWRARDPARLALAALAVGELIADKLPATPARTIPPAILFRALAGGFCGRIVAADNAGERAPAALAGATGAIVASYGGMALRKAIVRWTGLADPLVAVGEDALAIGIALTASRPR